MIKETRHYSKFRKAMRSDFSDLLGEDVYVHGTFKRADGVKMNVDGESRTVMRPKKSSYEMMKKLYFHPSIHNTDLEKKFDMLYDNPASIYTCLPKPALRFTRELIESFEGTNYNVAIDDVGAEFIDGAGINAPLHCLQMYRIIDSDYRIHYLLSTSMAMLESKSNELHNAAEITYNDDDMFWDEDYHITEYGVKMFMFALMQDYFEIEPPTSKLCSGILLLDPQTPDFLCRGTINENDPLLHDNSKNIRIGMLMGTDEIDDEALNYRNSILSALL